MPELPEVETALRGLERALQHQMIEQVEVRRRDLRWPIADDFEEVLTGQYVKHYRRFGKYLVLDLSNGISLLGHLGMSGTFRVEPLMPEELRKHDHMWMLMESGQVAIFCDPRRFGFLLLSETASLEGHPRLSKMGPDPFDEKALTTSYLKAALAKRKGEIKPILLNQSLIAGIGNIYASEALHLAAIHPKRSANSLKNKEINGLIAAIRKVLAAAITSGGSTLRDFVGAGGESGYFQHAFKVYDRAGEKCDRCDCSLSVEKQAGRSTFFCENCQK